MSIISAGGAVTGAGETPFNPRDYFNTVLYTGNGSTQSITGVGFQPDWVWIKQRNAAENHFLTDAVRGAGIHLRSDQTTAESDSSATFTAFTSDGFSLTGTGAAVPQVNDNTDTYVAWNWKANGAGVSNTDGTITSTVSVNTTSGFSIVAYTGNGTTLSTVGHGLGQAPQFIIIKNRDNTINWAVLHTSAGLDGGSTGGYNEYFMLQLNGTAAKGDFGDDNILEPTSTTFMVGTGGAMNWVNATGNDYVAYCFAPVAGFSAFGGYTGNGSATGPSVTTDFEPTFLMIKRTDSTGDWIIHDSARDASNPRTAFLEPNTSDAEGSGLDVDFNSTGFQIKSSSATVNANGGTYIYMCIA